MRKQSKKAKLITKCEFYLREILKTQHGNRCQLCNRTQPNLGLFHILPKGKYPKMRLYRHNILLVCWMPCHYYWHHDKDIIKPKVKALLGDTYEDDLKAIDIMQPKLNLFVIEKYLYALKDEYEKTCQKV